MVKRMIDTTCIHLKDNIGRTYLEPVYFCELGYNDCAKCLKYKKKNTNGEKKKDE
jgi:hypothetical protein